MSLSGGAAPTGARRYRRERGGPEDGHSVGRSGVGRGEAKRAPSAARWVQRVAKRCGARPGGYCQADGLGGQEATAARLRLAMWMLGGGSVVELSVTRREWRGRARRKLFLRSSVGVCSGEQWDLYQGQCQGEVTESR